MSTSESSSEQTNAARSGVISNLLTVSSSTLMSRVLGLLRDIGMAALFGAGTTLDAFIVAFRLPNLTRQLFGEGALTTAFLPVFLRVREEQGNDAARSMLSAVALVLSSILCGIVVVGELLAVWLIATVDLSPSTAVLLQLFMIFLPYMIFICMSALFCAALHSMKQFLWPALVPVVLNVVWLIGIGIAWYGIQDELTRVCFVAGMMTFAGGLQMLLPLVVLWRQDMGLTSSWRVGMPFVKEVSSAMVPIVLGVSVLHVNAVLDSFMAWGLAQPDKGDVAWCESIGIAPVLEAGTASALYIGQRMYQFPLGVFGIALGTVLFPILTQHVQRGEMAKLRHDLTRGLELIVAIALPASAGLFVLSGPMTLALFQHGHFTGADTILTARMIATYALGVPFAIGLTVMNRAFYATGDRITPMRLGTVSLLMNTLFNVLLVWKFGGMGLALGSVLATGCQFFLTVRRLDKQVGHLDWIAISGTLWKATVGTVLLVIACLLTIRFLSPAETFAQRIVCLFVPFLSGSAVYFLAAKLLRLSAIASLMPTSRRRES